MKSLKGESKKEKGESIKGKVKSGEVEVLSLNLESKKIPVKD